MTSPPILVSLDPNEAARPRAELIREAVEKDEHFFKPIGEKAGLPFDLRFIQEGKTLRLAHSNEGRVGQAWRPEKEEYYRSHVGELGRTQG